MKRANKSRPRKYCSYAAGFCVAAFPIPTCSAGLSSTLNPSKIRCAIVSWNTMMAEPALGVGHLARRDVDQLCSHSKTLAGMNEAGCQHRTNTELLPNLTRISLLSLVASDHGRRPDNERSNARQLCNHSIGK